MSGNPNEIFVGTARLGRYLCASGELVALKVACLLDEQDWRVLSSAMLRRDARPMLPVA